MKPERSGNRIRVLFVCWGNICRSPMAEFVMKDLVRRAGRTDEFVIASAATSREEIGPDGVGAPVYPPAREKLKEYGLSCEGKRARQLVREEYGQWDLLIGMEEMNLNYMKRICGGDPEGKMHRLLDFTDRPGDIADPWYSGDFDTTWKEITAGCAALFKKLTNELR